MVSTVVSKAVIPAAGLGTRFLPATKSSPKEMLPLVDKPIIQYVVEEAVASGVREIIVITGRGKRAIEDHFDVSFELEASLRENGKKAILKEIQGISEMAEFCYVRQRHAGGLGHALLCARSLVGNEPFAVLLGDDIIESDVPAIRQMIEVYQRYRCPVVGVKPVSKSEVHRYGIIKGKQISPGLFRVTDLVEKPTPEKAPSNLAVVGRYLLTPDIFDILEKTPPGKNQEIQLTDALRVLARQRPMYAKRLEGHRYDAGDKLGFLKATVEIGLRRPDLGKAFHRYLKGLKL
ncbi:MAG TPA: UTP--glucose-1-phosphate uridylyltransferase GalU [Nitrospiria bacterium]